jgi:hypothetical protein
MLSIMPVRFVTRPFHQHSINKWREIPQWRQRGGYDGLIPMTAIFWYTSNTLACKISHKSW